MATITTLQQSSTNLNYVLPFYRYWRGLGASIAFSVPSFILYMCSYRESKSQLAPYFGASSWTNYAVSGALAEMCSSVFYVPLEVVTGRLMIREAKEPMSTISMLRLIYTEEGLRGFYRGYWMKTADLLPSAVIWWASYDKYKDWRYQNKQELTATDYGMASAVATVISSTATNFLDVIITRQQLASSQEIRQLRPNDHKNVIEITRNLIKEVGLVRAMFKGLHVRLLHSLPSYMLCMTIMEMIHPEY